MDQSALPCAENCARSPFRPPPTKNSSLCCFDDFAWAYFFPPPPPFPSPSPDIRHPQAVRLLGPPRLPPDLPPPPPFFLSPLFAFVHRSSLRIEPDRSGRTVRPARPPFPPSFFFPPSPLFPSRRPVFALIDLDRHFTLFFLRIGGGRPTTPPFSPFFFSPTALWIPEIPTALRRGPPPLFFPLGPGVDVWSFKAGGPSFSPPFRPGTDQTTYPSNVLFATTDRSSFFFLPSLPFPLPFLLSFGYLLDRFKGKKGEM